MVLHCNGKLDEMREVARQTPELSGQALERAERALASRKPPQPFDRQAARAELDALMERAGDGMTAEILSFETGRPAEIADGEPALVVDVDGYEGPLDLLLTLARQQKVDLAEDFDPGAGRPVSARSSRRRERSASSSPPTIW